MAPHSPSLYVGIDGCRAGWIAVGLDDRGRLAACEVFANLSELWAELAVDARRILIDIPIGLPRAVRACDAAAKAILGRYNARVFLTPPRDAVYAGDYAHAARLTRELRGQGLSKQTWNICQKIREADELFARVPAAARMLRECHPEICFWAMTTDGQVVAENKRTPAGTAARVRLLEARFGGRTSFAPALAELMEAVRGRAAADDVLDAMAAAWCAAATPDELRSLPHSGTAPVLDERGLPAEIVYRRCR